MGRQCTCTTGCHHPRKPMIQYSETAEHDRDAATYWIPAGASHRARQRRDPVAGM